MRMLYGLSVSIPLIIRFGDAGHAPSLPFNDFRINHIM